MLLGFKKQFAPKILDGSKKFTIRNPRKREPKIGATLHMYTGLRTKNTEVISKEHTLKGIQLVDIYINIDAKTEGYMDIKVDGRLLHFNEHPEFVKADGFEKTTDFATYWMKSIGFKNRETDTWEVSVTDLIMYHWTDLRF
mgnify:CR=1 FL=1|tara:strand:- start:2 stop:424 length:423 start_codon:yes stop_codon:yes gene_type:complete